MNKIKGTTAALSTAFGLVACGGGDGKTPNVNHAPDIKNVPSSFSMPEGANRTINNIICSDQDGDPTTMTADSSNPKLIVSYDAANSVLNLDASAMNVADQTNENVDIALTCSDGELYDVKEFSTRVQDGEDDSYLTYITNIPESFSYNTNFRGTVVLNDFNGLPKDSIDYDILDVTNGGVAYSGTMTDSNGNGTYDITADLSALPAGPYRFQTESIDPVIGGENPQNPVIISQDFEITNSAPEALESSTDFERVESSKYTFSMTDAISDIEDTDNNLEIIITKQPVYTTAEDYQVGTINVISADNVEFNVNDGEGGDAFFTYKVKDSKGKLSEEKKYYLISFDNA